MYLIPVFLPIINILVLMVFLCLKQFTSFNFISILNTRAKNLIKTKKRENDKD